MTTPLYNAANAFLGWLNAKRHMAMFPLQPSSGDYTGGPDSDVAGSAASPPTTTGAAQAWAMGVVLVDYTTGLPMNAGSGGGSGGAVTAVSGAYALGSIVDIGTGASPGANTVNGRLVTLNTSLASLEASETGPTTGTATQVAGTVTPLTALASNTARKAASFVNEALGTAGAICYVLCSGTGTVSSTNYTYKLIPGQTLDLQSDFPYTGRITAVFASAAGALNITEFTT